MKKQVKRLIALFAALIMVLSLVGCKGGKKVTEEVDASKTQLYVYNFGGGYGTEWLLKAKERYEELHKDDVYEEGKKGIEIIISSSKQSVESQVLYNKEEVYFTEGVYYYNYLKKGLVADITEVVTKDLSVYGDPEGTTIESKLTDEQKAYYGVEEDGETHYYAVPHYAGYVSLSYNVDLFNEENYYFADGVTNAQELEDYFILSPNDKRSTGPDGQYGTYDDGLPATMEEFYLLCELIKDRNQVPVNISGYSNDDYSKRFLTALMANIDGKDQTMLTYTSKGTATNLGTATANGFVLDSTPTTITADNGYELYRSKGRYYALELMNELVTTEGYLHPLSYNTSYTMVSAQEEFLYAGQDNGITTPIAMIIEGCWWENEANSVFQTMEKTMGEEYARENRNFAFMPLPKASKEDLGKNVLLDQNFAVGFIKGNIEDWKKPIAMDFLAFVNSHESLVEFTQVTNSPKALQYSLTEEEMSEMSPFGRSVMELQQNSIVAYPCSQEPIYVNQMGSYVCGNLWNTIANAINYNGPSKPLHEKEVAFLDYFNGLYSFYRSGWSGRQK